MRTENYVMTVDPKSTVEMAQLASIRTTVKTLNKINKQSFRVSVKGRLGKNNPAAAKYKNTSIVTIALADAVRYDVYIHRRYTTK
jgi:hypothetical protein